MKIDKNATKINSSYVLFTLDKKIDSQKISYVNNLMRDGYNDKDLGVLIGKLIAYNDSITEIQREVLREEE